MIEITLGSLLFVVFVVVLVSRLLRPYILWYFKTDEFLKVFKQIEENTRKQ